MSTQPRGGYGPATKRMCYSCSTRRTTYKFDCRRKTIARVTGLVTSPLQKVALCQACAVELFGADAIESEIAAGRLSWKSQRPTQPQTAQQLSLTEEQL